MSEATPTAMRDGTQPQAGAYKFRRPGNGEPGAGVRRKHHGPGHPPSELAKGGSERNDGPVSAVNVEEVQVRCPLPPPAG